MPAVARSPARPGATLEAPASWRGWWWRRRPRPLRLLGWALGLLGFTGALAVPAPDRPVVRTAVFLAFEVEAWDGLENLEPGVSVAADFDL